MSDAPVLNTSLAMTEASFNECNLPPRELMLVRIAALSAADATPGSFLANVGTAFDSGLTLEDVQGTLVAIAPIIGSARTVTAAANIARALDVVIAVLDAELEVEANPA
jgi:alkylhydroperoxidase/carboxymuconolactone decarboxylase family protein YurZ